MNTSKHSVATVYIYVCVWGGGGGVGGVFPCMDLFRPSSLDVVIRS